MIITSIIIILTLSAFFIWFGKKIGMGDLEMAIIYLSIGILILIPRLLI